MHSGTMRQGPRPCWGSMRYGSLQLFAANMRVAVWQGRNDDAYALYVTLERHPNGLVAKRAKQMLFGFRSMDYLKTHTMSYSIGTEAYSKYCPCVACMYSGCNLLATDVPRLLLEQFAEPVYNTSEREVAGPSRGLFVALPCGLHLVWITLRSSHPMPCRDVDC